MVRFPNRTMNLVVFRDYMFIANEFFKNIHLKLTSVSWFGFRLWFGFLTAHGRWKSVRNPILKLNTTGKNNEHLAHVAKKKWHKQKVCAITKSIALG